MKKEKDVFIAPETQELEELEVFRILKAHDKA